MVNTREAKLVIEKHRRKWRRHLKWRCETLTSCTARYFPSSLHFNEAKSTTILLKIWSIQKHINTHFQREMKHPFDEEEKISLSFGICSMVWWCASMRWMRFPRDEEKLTSLAEHPSSINLSISNENLIVWITKVNKLRRRWLELAFLWSRMISAQCRCYMIAKSKIKGIWVASLMTDKTLIKSST